MIDKDTIEKIKEQADIVEVIGDYVDLKKAGSSYKGLSPFTEEKTPSFFVNPNKQIFKCFSTGKGGDSIKFMMELEGMGYVETLKYLAEKYNIQIQEEEATPEQIQQRTERDSLFIILNFAKDFYKDTLNKHDEGQAIGLSYFKERGFTAESIETFELGYSLDEWTALYDEAMRLKYSEEVMDKAGLIVKKEETKKLYDRFRGRVMFPIHNVSGKVIAFGARTLKKDKKVPKYVNSPETAVYHKSDVLYGVYQAKNEIRNKDNCFLVEGYTDVISMYQSGIKNVVASSGTSLTPGQIKLISRYTKNVTVIYDGDAAGIKASMRGIDLILEGGLDVNVVALPEGEDPDSYAQQLGGAGFTDYIEKNKEDFISFKTHLYLQGTENDPIKRANVIKEVVQSIAKIEDTIKKAVFFQQCASILGIDEKTLMSEHNKYVLQEEKKQKPKTPPSVSRTTNDSFSPTEQGLDDGPPPDLFAPDGPLDDVLPDTITRPKEEETSEKLAEREIIRLLLNYTNDELDEDNKLCDYIIGEIEGVEFNYPAYKTILEIFREELSKGRVPNTNVFLEHEDDFVKQEVGELLIHKHEISEGWVKQEIFIPSDKDILTSLSWKVINRLKMKKLAMMSQDILNQMQTAQSDDEVIELQKIYLKLKASQKEIADVLGITISGR